MGMFTWTEVIDITTGRIYADCADVERRLGIPALLVNACIQTGKSVNGHCFDCAKRCAEDGTPKWAHTGDRARTRAVTQPRDEKRPSTCDTATTTEDRARAVEMYKRGVTLTDISAALGRSVKTRDITRWNGGITPERPPGFWNHGRGGDIIINNKRPSWENPPSAPVDGLEGAESGAGLPASKGAPKTAQIKSQRPTGAETEEE